MSNRKKKNLMIVFLLIAVMSMSVGYTVLSTQLKTKVDSTDNNSVWDVRLTAITSIETEGLAKNISATIQNSVSAKFNSEIQSETDKVRYIINVKNYGTIDAKINTINIFPTDIKESNVEYFIEGIEEDEILKSGESKLFTLVAHYNKDNKIEEISNKEVILVLDYGQN